MSDFNQCIIMGRLTRKPELRYSPTGTPIAKIGVAANRKWRSEGELKEKVSFIDVTVFGKQAENVGQFLDKGSGVHILGRLETETWDDKATGQKRSKLTVVADSVQFIGVKVDTRTDAQKPDAEPAGAKEPPLDEDSPPF